MADLNIAIKIAAQDQGASGVIGRIQNALGGLSGSVKTGFAGLQDVIAGAFLGAVAAVTGFAAKGVSAFIDFQGQMNEVFTLLPGLSAEAMGAMTEDVKDFSREFGTLPDEVVPALYQSISAGVPSDNVFSFLETAQKAAVGGVTELETAVDGISSVVNAYGAEVLSATEASDLMFTAVRLGKTDFSQLSASLFQVIPTASSLGVEFGDVTAALAAMTAQGVPTSVATTQLRQLFVELSKDGGKAAGVFEEMAGVTFKDFIASGGNTAEALDLMLAGAEELGVGVSDLFGSIEAGNAALALAGSDTFVANIEEMGEAAGATETAYETMNAGLGRSMDRLQAFGETVLLDVGEAFAPFVGMVLNFAESVLPSIQAGLDTITFVVGAFTGALEEGQGPIEALQTALTTAFGPEVAGRVSAVISGIQGFLGTVASAIAPIVEFAAQFVTWQDVLVGVGLVIASLVIPALGSVISAVLPVIAVGAALVAGVALVRTAWEQNWGGIRDFLTDVWNNTLQPALSELWDWLQVAVPQALQTLSDFWSGTLQPAIANVWGWMTGTLFPTLSELWTWLDATLTQALQTLSDYWTGTLQPALEIVWGFVQDDLMPLFVALGDFFDVAFTLALTSLATLWSETLYPAIYDVWDVLKTSLKPILDTLVNFWEETLGPALGEIDFLETLRDVFNDIGGAIQDVIGFIGTLTEKLANMEVPDIFTPGSPTPFEIGLRGIGDALDDLAGKRVPLLGLPGVEGFGKPVTLGGPVPTPRFVDAGAGVSPVSPGMQGGGKVEVHVYIDGQELRDIISTEVFERQRLGRVARLPGGKR